MSDAALITALDRQDERAWKEFLVIASLLDAAVGEAWCLIGAQMVRAHAALAGADPPRLSRDLDLIGDSRARPGATKAIAGVLESRRFEPVGPNQFGTVHGFRLDDDDGTVVIDIFAPDNLGSRAQRTTSGNATTLSAPGGTFALRTATALPLELQTLGGQRRQGRIRLPSLAGALGIKACAVGVSNAPTDQLDDLILLLSLVDDPHGMRAEANGRKLAEMLRPAAERIAGRAHDDDRSLDALGVLAVLTDPRRGCHATARPRLTSPYY